MPTAYILQPRAHVRLRSERIEVWAPPEEGGSPQRVRDVPLFDLERIVLREGSQITSEALCALLRSEIPVGWIGWNDRFLGGFHPAANAHGAARLRQYQRTLEGDFALQIARQLVGAKIYNQKRLLQRLAANRSIPAPGAAHLNTLQDRVARSANREALLGLEGAAAACYFEGWASFLPPEFPFERRSTRPPHNPVNACLSFGATLLYQEAVNALQCQGLDPALGLLHATENGRWSLALDLIEPFRPAVADALAMDLFSRHMVDASSFQPGQGGIHLSEGGRRIFLMQYEKRMERQFVGEQCGHRTTLRDQLVGTVTQLKAALENPGGFHAFEMN